MPKDIRREESEPFDTLTRIGQAAFDAAECHPEWQDGNRMIVCVYGGKRGAVCHFGYDSDEQAAFDLIQHLASVFEANGKQLVVMPIGKTIGGDN